MKFRKEKSPGIINLDTICFPQPEHLPILEFCEENHWKNFNVFSLRNDQGTLIGYSAWGCPWNNDNIYLIRYGINPQYRKLGFGALLLTYTSCEIRKSYQGTIYADVRSENTTSRNLFKKAHWTECTEYDGAYDAENAIRVIHSIL